MKNNLFIIGLFLLGSFSLSGQGNDWNERLPFGGIFVFCDEPVQIDGTYHVIVDFDVNASGNVSFRYHINAKGKGVGLISGAKYEWNDSINDNFNGALGVTETFTQVWKVIGQGQASDFKLKQNFHITVNPNGDTTVLRGDFSAECN